MTAAYTLLQKNFEVLVIEKEIFPREKICAGALSPRCVKILTQIFGMEIISKLDEKFLKVGKVEIVAPNGRKIEGDFSSQRCFPGYGYVVSRKEFDNLLMEKVKAMGGEILFEKVVGINGQEVITSSGRHHKARFIILAAGFNSVALHGIPYDFVVQAFIQRFGGINDGKDLSLKIFFHKDLLPGYLWRFPEMNGTINVGGGFLGAKQKLIDPNFNLKNLIKEMAGQNPEVESLRYWPIPFNASQKFPVDGGIIPVGDAAGLANPITGEGIFYAVASGRLAALKISGGKVSEYFQELKELYSGQRPLLIFSYPFLANSAIFLAQRINPLKNYFVGMIGNTNQPLNDF